MQIQFAYLLCSSKQRTKMGSISLFISSSIGGLRSDESNFLADCMALSCTSGIVLPASSTKERRSCSVKGFSKSISSAS